MCAAGFRSGTCPRTAADRLRRAPCRSRGARIFSCCENADVGPRTLPDHEAGAAGAFAGVVFLPLAARKEDRRAGPLRAASGPIDARQDLVVDLDCGERGERAFAVPAATAAIGWPTKLTMRSSSRRETAAATPGARAPARDRRATTRARACGERKISAFELALVAHVDRVDRGAGHLLPRLDARRALRFAIVSAGAGVGDGAQDVVVGPAPAEVAGERARDLLAGRRRRAARGAPGIVEGARLDDEARRAEPALQARRAP